METFVEILHGHDWRATKHLSETDYCFTSTKPIEFFDEAILTKRLSLICDPGYNLHPNVHDEHIHWQPLFVGSKRVLLPSKDDRDVEINDRLKWLQQEARLAARSERLLDLTQISCKTVYLMHCFGWYPYGHFFDTIQRLFNLIGKDSFRDLRFAICGDTARVSSFMSHLEMFGIYAEQLTSFPSQIDSIRLNNLIVPNSIAEPSQYTPDSINWLRKTYLESNQFLRAAGLLDRLFHVDKPLALVLDRSGTGTRYISNQSDLAAKLERMGYKVIILTGAEPLIIHLYLFSKAAIVVSPHGSMMVNTIFCPPTCHVVEFIPAERRTLHFLRQCKPAKHTAFVMHSDENLSLKVNLDWIESLDL
jgi:hypothetical protein